MYKPAKFITEIPYNNFSTYYLFFKSEKILLPIEIEKESKEMPNIPSVHNSIKRIIYGTGWSVTGIKIYHWYKSSFYTYLTIKRNKISLDINIGFRDGIEIAKETSAPIFVNKKIIEKCGIEITKDLITKALKNQF